MSQIGVAIIGCGGITLQNHLPGLALCPETKVLALCDKDPAVLEKARQTCPVECCVTDYQEVMARSDIDAVIVATPNFLHAPIVQAAIAAGKHVFCEKPLAMSVSEAREMWEAAQRKNVRHMTAFTYRFVPAMRYMARLIQQGAVGRPFHFRSCRLQDWGKRPLGWRQVGKLSGTGELGDMLSHRIDYAHFLVGRMAEVVADTRLLHPDREGSVSDLEDWVGLIARFDNEASGVMESSKVATGRGESAHSQDYVEVNGEEGSLVFQLEEPRQLQVTKKGESQLKTVPVPKEFLVWPGSPRNPEDGDPLFNFRWDQNFEFIDAIRNERDCRPSFFEGLLVQAVSDAVIRSVSEKRWIEIERFKKS